MTHFILDQKTPVLAAAILLLALFGLTTQAQTEDTVALKARGKALIVALKYTEALPIYERLAKLVPKDSEVQLYLGSSLLAQGANTEDAAVRRQIRIRARNAFTAAKEAGDTSLFVLGMIEGIPEDGRDPEGFSDNVAANKAMQKAEAFFGSGKMNEAFNAYQEALALDPRCYYAALFSGDVKSHADKYDEAEKWYQRAIQINPDIETAYRYSAKPLMQQGKYDKARDRYIEAFVIDPYNKLAVNGLVQWGEATKSRLAHPTIEIPEFKIGPSGKADATIKVSPEMGDGSLAWMSYITKREEWRNTKFAKQFPKEIAYRHTLTEEAEALRSVISTAKAFKPKSLNKQIAILSQMDQDGVLEAYILLAIPDSGIAQDHAAYLRAYRDKLKLYVVRYVIGSGS
jgi:tetratricopeptide (TPR) repeat protein